MYIVIGSIEREYDRSDTAAPGLNHRLSSPGPHKSERNTPGGPYLTPLMNEMLSRIVDLIAALFGDTSGRPPRPVPLPPALPPPAPTPPAADPDEPQDAADLRTDDPIVVTHEAEPPRPDQNGPDYDPTPRPPYEDVTDEPPNATGESRKPSVIHPPAPEYRARYLWCIDNGHGALTRGKRSPVMEDGRQLLEYRFNRDVTARIFARLEQIGVAYYDVVPEVEVGNFLRERARRVNNLSSALPKLFVSVHGNAGPAPSLQDYTGDGSRGVETWYYHGSVNGRNLAAVFQRHLVERTGLKNRHLRSKVSGQFYVLRATRMPAILTENGFYNNRVELPLMLTEAFRQQVAEAHVAAILEVERDGL